MMHVTRDHAMELHCPAEGLTTVLASLQLAASHEQHTDCKPRRTSSTTNRLTMLRLVSRERISLRAPLAASCSGVTYSSLQVGVSHGSPHPQQIG